jgi:hypothetical protein
MEDGVLDFVVMQHADAGLKLVLHHMMPAGESGKPRYVRLYFETDEIHSLCRTLREKGYDASEPVATDYGSLEAQLTAPDGYSIRFQQWG